MPPVIQTRRMTPSTSIPEAAASAGLSATARVALPRRVFSSTMPMRAITTALITRDHRLLGEMETGPSWISALCAKGSCCVAPPK